MGKLLEDMLTHLKSNIIINANDGVDGFADIQPDQPDNCVALIEYTGVPAFTADICQRSVQVQVRDKVYDTARAKAWTIFKLWYLPESDIRKIAFTSSRWGLVSMRTQPAKLRTDESGRTVFAFNMGITTARDS